MRGIDHQQSQMFSYLSPETRVRKDHPLRTIRVMVDEILAQLSRRFDSMYASAGRPSIPPEKLLRAQLLQMLYSIRSERLLMEEIDYSVLFRWFVGLNLDEEVWAATTFTKNRERLMEAEVGYSGKLLVENRNGLIVDAEVFEANGTAERHAALVMLEQIPGTKPVTVGGDKGYDTADFVAECRHLGVTPHVAQNDGRRGGSAIDARTTRHASYGISQRKRKRIEECFGWLKTIALLRKVRHRGIFKVDWVFTFACAAYNLVRMRNLSRAAVQPG